MRVTSFPLKCISEVLVRIMPIPKVNSRNPLKLDEIAPLEPHPKLNLPFFPRHAGCGHSAPMLLWPLLQLLWLLRRPLRLLKLLPISMLISRAHGGQTFLFFLNRESLLLGTCRGEPLLLG